MSTIMKLKNAITRRYEKTDPVPAAPQLGYKREPTASERIRQMIRSEQMRMAAEAAGLGTFDEEDDFDDPDDPEPNSPYEEVFEGDVLQDAYSRTVAAKAASAAPSRGRAGDNQAPTEGPENVKATAGSLEQLATAINSLLAKKTKSE